jgi:Ca-activated chloride channel family protein
MKLALVTFAALAVVVPPSYGTAPSVMIESPGPESPLVGTVTVRFSVPGVPPEEIANASVLLDGRVAGSIGAPPWVVSVDAGEELRERRLEIRVRLHSGKLLSVVRTTARPAATEVEVRLVTLAVTVLDRSGKPVAGLQKDDFTVQDAGQPVALQRWDAESAPLAVALVVDVSLSMQGDKLEEARRAASTFVEAFAPQDLVGVFVFNDDVRTLAPIGADRARASASVKSLDASGGTALYDAVFAASKALAGAPSTHRRILVLLSDGRDEGASGLEPGSFHTLDEAIREAHRADTVVFALGLGAILDRETDFEQRMTTAEVLGQFASSTGGTFQRITRWTRIGESFRDVLEDVRRQYGMAYVPPPVRPGERWRKISIQVSRPGVTVRTREGYFVD